MNDQSPHPILPVPNLRAAIRNARVEEAERSQAVAELRGAELARLEMLRDAIEPVLAQIPEDVEMFDAGLSPGQHPRLFIDMIAFVEMAHDKRGYRFVQDTRYGRATLAESERLDVMTDAITAYIARRLVDREKALAANRVAEVAENAKPPSGPGSTGTPGPVRRKGWAPRAAGLLLEYLGIIALCVLVLVILRYAYEHWVALPH